MYISHFTKWTWFKLYFTFYHSAYWKYLLPRKNRQILVYCLLFSLPLSLFLLKTHLLFVTCFWMLMLLLPLLYPFTFLFLYSPKMLVCYKEFPTELEQEKIKNIFKGMNNISLDYYRNTLNKTYDLLLETPECYFIYKNYKKALVPDPSIILVINKKENQLKLEENNQNFLKFIQPKCERYIHKG